MKVFVSVLGWLNFFALTWAIILSERVQEHLLPVIFVWILFFIVATGGPPIPKEKSKQ